MLRRVQISPADFVEGWRLEENSGPKQWNLALECSHPSSPYTFEVIIDLPPLKFFSGWRHNNSRLCCHEIASGQGALKDTWYQKNRHLLWDTFPSLTLLRALSIGQAPSWCSLPWIDSYRTTCLEITAHGTFSNIMVSMQTLSVIRTPGRIPCLR